MAIKYEKLYADEFGKKVIAGDMVSGYMTEKEALEELLKHKIMDSCGKDSDNPQDSEEE